MRIKIFDKSKAKEILPNNEPKLLLVGDKEVCLVRKGDEIFAFENICPHMGQRLHQGNTNYLGEIVCPLHTYRFHMKTGIESSQPCKNLKLFRIIYVEEVVFLEY